MEVKRREVAILIRAGHSSGYIANLASLKTVYNVRKRIKDGQDLGDKPRSGRPVKLWPEAGQAVFTANPRMTMTSLAKNTNVSKATVSRAVKKAGGKSLRLVERPLLSQRQQDLRLERCGTLLNSLKHHKRRVIFYSDEKTFTVDPVINKQNDRVICFGKEDYNIRNVSTTKHPASVMMLGVVASTDPIQLFFQNPQRFWSLRGLQEFGSSLLSSSSGELVGRLRGQCGSSGSEFEGTAQSDIIMTTTGPSQEEPKDDNVKVVVRVRPLNSQEREAKYASVVQVDHVNGEVKLEAHMSAFSTSLTRESPAKVFAFDNVFGPDSTQMDVYNRVARPIVENVIEGYNGTIFAYGQTGTGKTFTMEGERSSPEMKGIIPNSFAHIFGHIAKAEEDIKFLVRVSYLEIYNEEVRDLLGKDQTLRLDVKERPDIGVYVKDLSAFVVNNADDMDKIMTIGNKNRSVGATHMNAHSSRSHAIFTITIECSEKGEDGQQHFRVGKLHLVDLAGSERQSKTGATGKRLKEATKINLSLSTLGNVISALVDGKSSHVPYRNSKLTRLLQDSLGGNSKTLMFANVGPAEYNYDETLSTLRYASRAKSIQNHAKVNEDPKDALLKQYQKEIEELKKLLEDGSDGSSSEEGATDEDDVVVDGETKSPRKKKKSSPHSEQELSAMREQIETERTRLRDEKNMAEEERNSAEAALKEHEEQLGKAQSEYDTMKQKLMALEKKIIVGGENLLDKAEEQEKLLDESAKELEETVKRENELRHTLQQKEAERMDIEEKYSSLQEEAAGKSRKLKKVWNMYQSAKAELHDLQTEQQREMEGLLDNVRHLTRELRLQMLVIDSFIPGDYQELIERNVQWNEDIGEWQLKCVAYTGNNMRKRSPSGERDKDVSESDLSHVYLSYSQDGSSRPRTAKKSGRPKSSRPKSRR
eukprot:snap_masked-scaffold1099_size62903-processed-gene-0.6 protein:Tk01128 transcript:snap_masked-scaffold1099_size62903-processed-gene-0.6-mRNA-1 annotation:"kinesin-like protein kif3a isoform x2"